MYPEKKKTRMPTLEFCVLGSGSSGNCSLLRLSNGAWVMIDAGFSMKQTKERMRTHGLRFDMVSDVLLTHLDRDHFNPAWCRTFQLNGTRVHMHAEHVDRAKRAGIHADCIVAFDGGMTLHGTEIETIRFAHDVLGTVGFIFDNGGVRFGFATDLGRVPDELLDRFVNLDAVAFESNYDPIMQEESNRPDSLKERITNGQGHLSNEQSLAAITHIASASQLQHVVLLHLSQQCNAPSRIRDLYQDNLPHLYSTLTLTSQDRCSHLLSIAPRGAESQIAA